MNMYLSSQSRLSIFFIVQTLHLISYHYIVGVPILQPRSISESQNSPTVVRDNSTEANANSDIYHGYPQQEEMKKYLPYLLRHINATKSLRDSVNLALWKNHYNSKREACDDADKYIKDFIQDDSGPCQPTYTCDYDKERFPTTLIAVDCGDGYCVTTSYVYKVRGSCLGVQNFINTLKFVPDEEPEGTLLTIGAQNNNEEDASGREELNLHNERKGKWGFQTLAFNSRCSCRAK